MNTDCTAEGYGNRYKIIFHVAVTSRGFCLGMWISVVNRLRQASIRTLIGPSRLPEDNPPQILGGLDAERQHERKHLRTLLYELLVKNEQLRKALEADSASQES